MEAGHYTRKVDAGSVKWEEIPDYGRTVSSMALFPSTAESAKPPTNSPCLEYQFYLFNSGTYTVSTYTAPSFAFDPAHGLRYGVSIDDQTPQTLQIFPAGDNVKDSGWSDAVIDNIIIRKADFSINSAGYHTLKVWMVDPGVVLQKIVINTGGLKPSFLGPPESCFGKMSTVTANTPGSKKVSAASQFIIHYNPLSAKVVIKYASQQDGGQVNMNIYNLRGMRIATIRKKVIKREPTEILCDAAQTSAGIYICRITVDSRNSWTQRIVIRK